MSDKATLVRLLREMSEAETTENTLAGESQIISLWDSRDKEFDIEIARLVAEVEDLKLELEFYQRGEE